MTTNQRNRVLAINAQITELRKGLNEAMLSGTSSASLSTAGNSQSYTRIAASEYRIQISALTREKQSILSGGGTRRTSPDFGN